MKKTFGQQRRPSQPVHKALGLPSTYSTRIHIEGWVGTEHWTLKRLRSTTLGQTLVWASSINWGDWQEISGERFNAMAQQILN